MKILHAADLHIDSPLWGLSQYEGAPVDEIRGATRRAAVRLVDAALTYEVSLVVIAGDVFDGDWRDFSTGLFWTGQLNRLRDAGIPVIMISGNHDAASEITRNLTLPDNATMLSATAPQSVDFPELGLRVVGQSYSERAVTDDLAAGYPPASDGVCTIGVLHTSLSGRPGHGNYAPTSIDVLRSKGYSYWALGHVHQREIVSRDPWIVFPGNPQGRHAKEVGEKGATLVTITDGDVVDVTAIPLDVVRWVSSEIDIAGSLEMHDVVALIREHLTQLRRENPDRLCAVRLRVSGRTQVHDELWRQPGRIEAEVRAVANAFDDLWIEKVVLATQRMRDADGAQDDDAVRELLERIADLANDPEALDAYAAAFQGLRDQIATTVRGAGEAPIELSHLGSSEHLRACLADSKDMIMALLDEGQ